jgi:excisionase family DNA binding protein
MEQKYFSTTEIAEMLEVNRYTVSLWVDQGEIKAMITPGGHKKVAREEVVRFIKARGGTPPPELEPVKAKKIFIIDDEKDVARYLSKCVRMIFPGVETEIFDNPVYGLMEIGKTLPDMVILDIVMPNMDGISVCRSVRFRKETEKIKILAVSGKYDRTVIQSVLAAGADDFYYKLSPVDELMGMISKHLGVAPEKEKLNKLIKTL